jgi:hypothetical protein
MDTKARIERFKETWKEYSWIEDALGLLEDDIPEGEFKPKWIDTIEEYDSRWMNGILEVVEIDEGVYIGVRWEQGKTEMQENMYDDNNVYLLERVEKVVTTVEWNDKEKL